MRFYCQHWDCFDSRFSIPSPIPSPSPSRLTIMIFIAYDQPAYRDNCFELFEELENDVTYNEAKDHCENLNGTLINENRISDVVMV